MTPPSCAIQCQESQSRKHLKELLTSLTEEVFEVLPPSVERKLNQKSASGALSGTTGIEGVTDVGDVELTTATSHPSSASAISTVATSACEATATGSTAEVTSRRRAGKSWFGLAVLVGRLTSVDA